MEQARPSRPKPVIFEGVPILYRNFAGKEGQYNKAGDREFSIALDESTAQAMEADGWNIKWPKPKDNIPEEEDLRLPTLPIAVSYKLKAPMVTVISARGQTLFEEGMLELLDDFEIKDGVVDLKIQGSVWDVNGKMGIKAYLLSLYITIVEDPLIAKYGLPGKPAGEEDPAHIPF